MNENMVSIIIPVYNVERYLDDCIQSILNQTNQSYELILVNDGSKDRSGEICDRYAAKYEFVRVFHQANQGQAAARNFGVEQAKYDWIVFVDSDDVAHPQMIEFFVRTQTETEAKIVACLRQEGERTDNSFFMPKNRCVREITADEPGMVNLFKTDADCYWALFPSLIEKSIYIKNPMPVGRIYEDNAICCQWIYAAKRIVLIEDILYFYRKNPNSTMNQKFSSKQLDYLWALNEQMRFFKKIGYKEMVALVFDEYVNSAIHLSREVERELSLPSLKKKVLADTIHICRDYKDDAADYSDCIKRLDRERHPLKYRIIRRLYRIIPKKWRI